jgi:glycosyltransferase involved in cell wall biosynthesis
MPTKILIISPTPTHPTNAGNRRGILSLANNLKQQGFDLSLLLLEYESGDARAMKEWWNDKIFFYSKEKLFGRITLMQRVQQKFIRTYWKYKKKINQAIGNYAHEEARNNSFIDEHYPVGLTSYIKKIQRENQFDAVIVIYVFLSRSFLAFDKKFPKVLDTHDVFSDRYKRFLQIGQEPSWISFFPAEEKKGFNRADLILSVQQNEIDFIKKLGVKKQVLLIGHTLNYDPAPSSNKNSLLFVSSHNPINVSAINDFIQNVFPVIKENLPDCKLIIAGSIDRVKSEIFTGEKIEFLGEFENIKEAYMEGYVVICPIQSGTGIKVKLLEALSFGKPSVATPAAAEGLEKFAGQYFLVGKDHAEQARLITGLFIYPEQYNALENSLKEFCDKYNQSTELNKLYNFFESRRIDQITSNAN